MLINFDLCFLLFDNFSSSFSHHGESMWSSIGSSKLRLPLILNLLASQIALGGNPLPVSLPQKWGGTMVMPNQIIWSFVLGKE
jgi:hypothetical protein